VKLTQLHLVCPGRPGLVLSARRWLIALASVAALIALAPALATPSGASFTDSSTSNVSGSADNINRYLHVYSQSTDPDGYTGYFHRRGSGTTPAATGVDDTLAVNIGGTGNMPQTFTCNYLFGLKVAPAPLPRGLTQVTLTVTAGPDQATGKQPLVMTGSNTVTGPANAKYYFSVDVNVSAAGGFVANRQYIPHLYVTVTYTGFTTLSYYQYDIPVKVYTGTGAGLNSAQTSGETSSARGLTRAVNGVPIAAPSIMATPTPSVTHKPKPSVTPKPTSKPTPSAKPIPTATPSPSPTATPSATSTPAPAITTKPQTGQVDAAATVSGAVIDASP
jgi:hypothetical protein